MLPFYKGLVEKTFLDVVLVILHTQRLNRTSESIINSGKFICSNLIYFPKEKVSINRLLTPDK